MKLNGKIVDLLPQGGDITAPTLRSLSISPASVDTSAGPQTITVTVRVTDDRAGVATDRTQIQVDFNSPSGGQHVTAFSNWTRIAGHNLDGTYQTTVTVPAYSEQGTWFIPQVHLTDAAGNATHIKHETLAAAGYPTTFEVVRTA